MKRKRIMMYFLISCVFLLLISILIAFPSYQKQMKEAGVRLRSESRILDTKYGKMEYAMNGNGIPVLLVHGAGGGFDQGLWLGEICLNGDYQFIAPSRFGYLNSEAPDNFSAKHQAEQYQFLLDHLGIEKVIVIGVSAGGPSSMQFAYNFPERVDKLVLLSAVSMPPTPNDKAPVFIHIIQIIQKSDFGYWLFTKAFRSQMLSLLGIPVANYKKFNPIQKQLAEELLQVMHPMSLRYKGTIIDGQIIQNFIVPDNIVVPTLIIHAKNDGLVSYSHAEHAHQNIKDSKIILYEEGGHGIISALEDARINIDKFLRNQNQLNE